MKFQAIIRMVYNTGRFSALKLFYKKRLVIKGFCFISPSTRILIGKGSVSFGRSIMIEKNGYISASAGGNLSIGDRTFINRNCYIACRNRITIGADCIIGPNVSFYDHNHKFDNSRVFKSEYKVGHIVLEDGCWIGDGAKLLKGAYVGRGSVIGAGTVVSGNVAPHSIVRTKSITIEPIR